MDNDIERRVENALTACTNRITLRPEPEAHSETVEQLASGRQRDHRPLRWLMPLAVAAATVTVAGATFALSHGGNHSTSAPQAAPSSQLSGSGDRATSSAAVNHTSASATARTGTSSHIVVPSHCGIKYLRFDGRNWVAVNPIPEPPTRPDSQGNASFTGGTPGMVTKIGGDILRLAIDESKVDSAVAVVTFHPTTKPIPICEVEHGTRGASRRVQWLEEYSCAISEKSALLGFSAPVELMIYVDLLDWGVGRAGKSCGEPVM